MLGANAAVTLFIEPGAGKQPIIDAINNARREILVEVYLLSDREIISALDDADNRGVSVKVMLEEHPFGGGNLNTRTAATLQADNIPHKWANPAYALTHEKSIVIDGSEAFILSQNLTNSSFTKNREYDVLDTDPTDVTEVRNIFIADWERQPYTPPQTHLLVSPVNSRAGITALIEDARQSLAIEIEDINDDEIVSLLSQKAKTITVRVIVPTLKQISANAGAVEKLQQAGVSVKEIASPHMHAKMILADETKAYVGSVNFSAQSLDKNRELGIILSEQEALRELRSTFSADWQVGSSL